MSLQGSSATVSVWKRNSLMNPWEETLAVWGEAVRGVTVLEDFALNCLVNVWASKDKWAENRRSCSLKPFYRQTYTIGSDWKQNECILPYMYVVSEHECKFLTDQWFYQLYVKGSVTCAQNPPLVAQCRVLQSHLVGKIWNCSHFSYLHFYTVFIIQSLTNETLLQVTLTGWAVI